MSEQKSTILVVEDDAQLRFLLCTILKQAGYEVRSVADGFAALAEIRLLLPDILLSDLYMEGMSGFELLSVVQRRFPGIRVVAMSSAFTETEVPVGISADAFYPKATSIASLLAILETMLDRNVKYVMTSPGAVVPVWVDAPVGEDYFMMTCPECLRPFPLVLGKTFRFIHKTDCVFCRSLIHYAIVEPDIPPIARPLPRNAVAEWHASSSLLDLGL